MKKDDEPKLWVTVLKLVVGAIILIGGVGGALWLAGKADSSSTGTTQNNTGWGISTDSPIRSNR